MWHKTVSPILNSLSRTALGLFRPLRQRKHRYLSGTICALVLLACAAFNDRCVTQTLTGSNALAAASQGKRTRIVTLRHNDTTEGSRCTLTSDSQLGDYSFYVEGERFFVRVPQATLVKAHTLATGSGFTDMRAEQSGDDVVISFLLKSGATVHLNQSFNRLEINFLTNERVGKSR